MSQLQYSRLCQLIDHPFTVKSAVSITKEQEKSLLITLSQVLNKVKLWIAEFDSDSGSDSENGDHTSDNQDRPFIDTSKCHPSASPCLLKIINDLVLLLAVESRFVQHLAVNVVVSVSEYVVASGSYWEEVMQSICFHLKLIICKVISPCSDPTISVKHIGCDSAYSTLDLQPVLNNASWHSVGAIVLVLRTILKQLKHEDNAKILEIYFRVLGSCLQDIPWDSCNGALFVDVTTPPESWFEFCGYLLQLFCSLADCEDENPTVREILNVFPNILSWYFGKQGENHNSSISRYIQHKILVLMIRLSSLINLDCVTVVSWLKLIEKYFQDLLSESVSEPMADQDDCLGDSPFNGTSHRHLQRRVIFLYLKCSFSLIGLNEKRKKQCSCGNMNSCSQKGLITLYEWIKKHLPGNILDKHELYDDCCKSFTKSFIQLYMHEDDMLFKILLQLTYTPFEDTQQITDVAKKEILFLLSDIFDPVRLFHLFLSELHYDHQVLLDYLISKDTGTSCAEYLLRCLRIICEKWGSFFEFPFRAEVERQSCPKRRKFENGKNCQRAFYKARDCLLLLKKSVESLHQKDLFPYNPQVLLQRLIRFLELCLRQ
ncbi:hypothetical protein QVD17_17786 [Tagetes erecta]|uniref:Protein Lines C-terminal domain-containing protein n=1 Tax=Tagetes erecta TaxID=13708 RepID=A0AAD8KXJ8_TARER|nr:hypothetical protein QVD17_17786 [Tagetes erecta]